MATYNAAPGVRNPGSEGPSGPSISAGIAANIPGVFHAIDLREPGGPSPEETAARNNLVEMANRFRKAGCLVHPAKADGSKQPLTVKNGSVDGEGYGWKRVASGDVKLHARWVWGKLQHDCDGIGLFTGAPSGNLEMFELEGRAAHLVERLEAEAESAGHAELWHRFNGGFSETTPSGGIHWLIRNAEVTPGNTKLAMRPNPDDPDKPLCFAETRGTGGWVVVAGSFGRTHSSGKPYVLRTGGPETIPTFTTEERAAIEALFRTLDELPEITNPEPVHIERRPRRDGEVLPGDDFNDRGSWAEALPAGWAKLSTGPKADAWSRHGARGRKTGDVLHDSDTLYIFDTECPPTETALSKFAAFAWLQHGGDFKAATKALAAKGYGSPLEVRTRSAKGVTARTKTPPPKKSDSSATVGGFTGALPPPGASAVVGVERGSVATAPDDPKNTVKTSSDNHRSVRSENPNLGNPPSPEPQNDPISSSEPRVEIHYRAEEQARIVDECLVVMSDQFFVRSGELVHVANADNPKVATSAASASVIVRTTKETVSDFLSRNVEFVVWEPIKPGKGDANQEPTFEPKTIPVPRWLPERLVGMQTWRFVRRLAGIAHGPFLRLDGTIGGRTPGYDDASEIMVIGDAGWPEIPDTPTDADVRQAVDQLLNVVREFPFDNPAGKAVWLSAVLSAVARPAIAGPVPLHVVDASTRGSGKSKLCKVASLIAEGVEPAMESLSPDDREMDKRLLAVLAEGSRVIVFDNIQGPVGGASLDRFLTATVYGGRVLGSTQMLKLPNLTVPLVTTNNASVTADTARRCVSLRLTPDDELPEERTFDVPNLEEHVRARRRELLSAALVILRNHAAKGFPIHAEAFNQADDGSVVTVPVRPKGSFEAWSRVVRHAIIGAGLPDPEVTSKHVREVDSRHAANQAFVEALAAWNPGWNGSARQLVSEVFDDQASGELVDDLRSAMLELAEDRSRRGTVSSKLLGVVVRGIRDRWFHNVRLVSTGHSKTGNTFALDSRVRPNHPDSR
jgi:hypothetical protein